MEFSIYFTESSDFGSWGELWLEGSREVFEASFAYWDREQYRLSWRQAVAKVLETDTLSALITCMTDPKEKSCIDWWPMYPVGDEVVFRNDILSMSRFPCATDEDIYKHIGKRGRHEAVSEWVVSKKTLQTWLNMYPRQQSLMGN